MGGAGFAMEVKQPGAESDQGEQEQDEERSARAGGAGSGSGGGFFGLGGAAMGAYACALAIPGLLGAAIGATVGLRRHGLELSGV